MSFNHILLFNCARYLFSRTKCTMTLGNGIAMSATVAPHNEMNSVPHVPVLVDKVIQQLQPKESQVILDMTFGAGGHARHILEAAPNVKLVTLDRDPTSREFSQLLQEEYPGRMTFLEGKFSDLPTLLTNAKFHAGSFSSVLMDVGTSSMQFDNPERGFMLSQDGPLDMRMDMDRRQNQPTAADILAHIEEHTLYKVLKVYGEEKRARVIARGIVEARYTFKRLQSTKELAQLVATLLGMEVRRDALGRVSHPATKTFQAIRILVNDELNQLDFGLKVAHHYLCNGGRLAVICFHSLEDAIVKRHFTGMDIDETPATVGGGVWRDRRRALSIHTDVDTVTAVINKPWRSLLKHVVMADPEEVMGNPRSRSAKLRVAEKVDGINYAK